MNGNPAVSAPAAPVGPNGQPQPRRRRPRPPTDALRAPRRPLKTIQRPLVSLTQMNESGKKKDAGPTNSDGSVPVETLRQQYLSQGARAFPLVVTRRDLKELRHHVMRLQNKGRVDIQNEEDFTPPIRLHRRDPRAPPSGAGAHFEEEDTKEDIEESKERERIEMQKEERRKVREENLAKIAPSGVKKPTAFQKKTEQKYRPDDTPEAKKRQLLRYEETLPWHLEDFDNKQTWVGTYESELSEAHIMLTTNWMDGRGGSIQLAPMERWYKFNVKSKVKLNTVDDLDKAMLKEEKVPKFLSNIEMRSIKREQEAQRSKGSGMRTRVGGGADDEGRIKQKRDEDDYKVDADADDLDFNHEDDFADDEEGLNGLFEGDEQDVKEASEKVKRDQLAAALWDRDEEQVLKQEQQELEEAERRKLQEKNIRKMMVKREKQIDYDDSDRENPYLSSSETDTDSETERKRAKEEEERKAAEQNGKAPEGGNVASGASTKGSNTPSGNHKSVDLLSKKRRGSPNLSEASGNESSRKKHKKKHDKLADGSRKSALLNDAAKRGAASGSDSEMTDAGKSKKAASKLKLRVGNSPNGSPGSSRAGSPAASQVNGSRAGSPAAPSPTTTQPRMPSAREIYEALPAQGVTIQDFINAFRGRVDKSHTQLFIRLVKAVSSYDKQRSWLVPLPQMPSEEHISAVMNTTKKPAAPKSAAASPS